MNEYGDSSIKPDGEFKLSITRALADQLDEALGRLTPAPLSAETIAGLVPLPGVYQLYYGEELVYVGKASKSLVQRLTKHHVKLTGRGVNGVSFVCLYVDEDLEASAPEKMLIKRRKQSGLATWNTNGFGNNDPGVRRDLTAVKENHFDAQYPIDLDYPISLSPKAVKKATVAAALADIKKKSPYLLRFHKSTPGLLRDTPLADAARARTMSQWLSEVVGALPEGWQATALPGYVVVYEVSDPEQYLSASCYWRKENGHVVGAERKPTWDTAGEIKEKADDEESDDDED